MQELNSTGGELLLKGCCTKPLRALLAINVPQKEKEKDEQITTDE
jgi:hypothetical protein